MSACRRRKIEFRQTYNDQEVSTMLMTLCKRDTPLRRYVSPCRLAHFPSLFTLVGGEALERLVQFLIGAFNAVWDRDLA